jgi:hypothetical protein
MIWKNGNKNSKILDLLIDLQSLNDIQLFPLIFWINIS